MSKMPLKSSNDLEELGSKSLWIRADKPESWNMRKSIILAAAEINADLVILDKDDLNRTEDLGLKRVGVIADGTVELPPGVVRLDPDPGKGEHGGNDVALVEISSGVDQDSAAELAGSYQSIVVECKDWHVIPLENLVAACQHTGTKLLTIVTGPKDAAPALGALQKGVDGILLQPGKPSDVQEILSLVRPSRPSLKLVETEVVSVLPIGIGDRACVDTCSMLEKGEGLLVGSQADGLVLVHGETIKTEYVESRPFRVNAGAIHSYILHLDDKTRYLSDLRAGDPALIVGADGSTRVVTIGRVKIETRPLSMLELKYEEDIFKVILQDAETIRLVRPDGGAVSIKELKKGDRVLAYLSGKARHFGMPIEERVIER